MGMVPTRTGKPGEMVQHFPVREKSEILLRLEKLGNFTQNTGKVRKIYSVKFVKKKKKKILEKSMRFVSQ